MTQTHAIGQDQLLLSSTIRLETDKWTDGQMDGRRRLHYTSCANAVGKNFVWGRAERQKQGTAGASAPTTLNKAGQCSSNLGFIVYSL